MSHYISQAKQISASLNLSIVPVAISFCDVVPSEIPMFDGRVAAGCEFWEKAASSLFATSAKDHQLCSIGLHTHNLSDAPASQQDELTMTLKVMTDLDYVRQEEVAAIPVRKESSKYVIYGPLANFPLSIDVVVVFANAQQGLILSEAIERVDKAIPLAMGRPACAVLPHVINNNQASMSLGCCGARSYIDALDDSAVLWALPGNKLQQYSEQIEIMASANNVLSSFHQRRKADVAAGKTLTIKESLMRM